MDQDVEISLFPIPGSVSFPLTSVPLHIFEPRYRLLVKDAVRLHRRIGVCHTKKTIHQAKAHQSPAEILSSNQATYEPHSVFSAGFAEITDITPDGRLLADIGMDGRYKIIEEIQTLPYRIVRCSPYSDISDENESRDAREVRALVNSRLIKMSEDFGDELADLLRTPEWAELSTEAYSFKIFQIVRFDPDVMQMVLEMKTAEQRLGVLLEALSAK